MDAIRLIIEWCKKKRQPLYQDLVYQADMDYADLKEDHALRVKIVQELLKENRELHEKLDGYDDRISITHDEYLGFLDAQEFLNVLREFGVDNWNGYSDALESLK